MGKLVNIDNGGTLTDFCALDNGKIYHTKTLTTPYDLSQCFFDGLKKLALAIYGDESHVDELIQSTDYIRYSTTQGTNALVERKGPRLGLLVDNHSLIKTLTKTEQESRLFKDLVEKRVAVIDCSLQDDAIETNIVQAVNNLSSAGANRIVLSINNADFKELEAKFCRIIGRKFPSHLLGVVPVLSASALTDDRQYPHRTWTAIFNAFLHPSMERFLYSADHRLKSYNTNNPLLIYRNDGGSARVAKTMAIKTYSSGPSGGMQGAEALARHYGYTHLVTYDVGGTTTDIGVIKDGKLQESRRGKVEGIRTSFPFPDIHSVGVGGSSIITTNGEYLSVGPQSVGAAPGPACFALGGKKATITDVFLLLGVLDPSTYFGGKLKLDEGRAREVISSTLANPLALSDFETLEKMRDTWVTKIANSLKNFADINEQTILAGFGGAGALAATRIAEMAGAKRVIIPAMGAVFSAFGIGFSPLSQEYRVHLPIAQLSVAGHPILSQTILQTRDRARRDMFAEGVNIDECNIEIQLLRLRKDSQKEEVFSLTKTDQIPFELHPDDEITLLFRASKAIQSLAFSDLDKEPSHVAKIGGQRMLLVAENDKRPVPIYRLNDQLPGASAEGPAIIEEEFFTGFLEEGWQFYISSNRDLILEKIL